MDNDNVEGTTTASKDFDDHIQTLGGDAAAITAILILVGLLMAGVRKAVVAFSHAGRTYTALMSEGGLLERTENLEIVTEQLREGQREILDEQIITNGHLAALSAELASRKET